VHTYGCLLAKFWAQEPFIDGVQEMEQVLRRGETHLRRRCALAPPILIEYNAIFNKIQSTSPPSPPITHTPPTVQEGTATASLAGVVKMDDDDLDALLDDAAEDVLSATTPQNTSVDAQIPASVSAHSPSDSMLEDAISSVFAQPGPPSSSSKPRHGMLPLPRPLTSPPKRVKAPPTLEDALSAVLPAPEAEKWRAIIQADVPRLEGMRTHPPSFAYRSFLARGGGDYPRPARPAKGDREGEEEGEAHVPWKESEGKGGQDPGAVLTGLMMRACTKAGVADTEGLRQGLKSYPEATKRLEALFLKQLARDLKPVVAEDENFDPTRFPATARNILGRAESGGEG